MIRHGYTACAQCHLDPSGGGPLTQYGRAMGEVILKSQYAPANPGAEGESADPGPGANFLWGAFKLPDFFDLGGSVRVMELVNRVTDTPIDDRLLLMQSDLNASLRTERWIAAASLGYSNKGGLKAALTRNTEHNLVSRYHWVGYRLDADAAWTLRAGRMYLPFGIRDVLHTLWVRSITRTSIDEDQQHGVALSYSGENLRAELMAIAGNFQVRPDDFRERGATGFVEWAPKPNLAAGASGRLTHVALDPRVSRPAFRHAYGVFGRWAPIEPLVLMAEADYAVDSYKEIPRNQGFVGMAQVDIEPIQGLHYQTTLEARNFGASGSPASFAGWATLLWFLASHVDVRLDGIYTSQGSDSGAIQTETLLAQLHLYL
jgi:hypothetical protein